MIPVCPFGRPLGHSLSPERVARGLPSGIDNRKGFHMPEDYGEFLGSPVDQFKHQLESKRLEAKDNDKRRTAKVVSRESVVENRTSVPLLFPIMAPTGRYDSQGREILTPNGLGIVPPTIDHYRAGNVSRVTNDARDATLRVANGEFVRWVEGRQRRTINGRQRRRRQWQGRQTKGRRANRRESERLARAERLRADAESRYADEYADRRGRVEGSRVKP